MSKTTRRKFSSAFKSKVSLEAIKEQKTIEELSMKFDIHPSVINSWKKEFITNADIVFEKSHDHKSTENEDLIQRLYAQIGQLKVDNDYLKKKLL
jgi:transposase